MSKYEWNEQFYKELVKDYNFNQHFILEDSIDFFEAHLKTINDMKRKFKCQIGLSDHTNKIKTSIYSYISGARIFEKHFFLGKQHNIQPIINL